MAFLNETSPLVDISQWLGQSSGTNERLLLEMLLRFSDTILLTYSASLPYATFPSFRSSLSFSSHSLVGLGPLLVYQGLYLVES